MPYFGVVCPKLYHQQTTKIMSGLMLKSYGANSQSFFSITLTEYDLWKSSACVPVIKVLLSISDPVYYILLCISALPVAPC